MKLTKYAENHGITYTTAYRQFHKGQIAGAYQLDSGTIVVPEKQEELVIRGKPEQIEELKNFCSLQNMSFTSGTINCLTLGDNNAAQT